MAPAGLRGGAGEAPRHLMSRTRQSEGSRNRAQARAVRLIIAAGYRMILSSSGVCACGPPGLSWSRQRAMPARRTAQVTVTPIPGRDLQVSATAAGPWRI
jgi:hypothetical protein